MNNTRNIELELSVVSSLLNIENATQDMIDECMVLLSDDCFTQTEALYIYRAIRNVYEKGMKISVIDVNDEIMTMKLDIPMSRVLEISMINIIDFHLIEHCKRLRELAMLRLAILKSDRIKACAEDGRVDDTYTGFLEAANSLESFMFKGMSDVVSWQDQIANAITEIEEKQKRIRSGETTGVITPLNGLNGITGGWQDSDLVILAARPSMGKTAFALQIMKTAAQQGKTPLFFSLEMSRTQLLNRYFTDYTGGIDPSRYELKEEEWKLFEKGVSELEYLNCYIEDKSGINIEYVRSLSSIMKRRGNCDMIIVDYLQLVSDSLRAANRDEQVGYKTKHLKELARTLQVPVICLAQLNRSCEQRTDKRPLMSDLRESGNIEQDADLVMFLYRDAYYGIETTETTFGDVSSKGMGELIIRKNRHGGCGVVHFNHNETLTKFSDFDRNISSF